MTMRHLIAAALVLALILPGAAFGARGDLGASSQNASFSINAYSWLNKYHMDIAGTNLGNTLNDLATGTNASFMVVGTAHWRSWAFAFDGVFNSVDQSTRVGNVDVRMDLSQTMLQPLVGYKILDSRNPRDDTGQALWLDVGGRYWDNKNAVTWSSTPSDPVPIQGAVNLDGSWWDLLVGATAHFKFTDFVHGYLRGNVGGFGMSSSSDFTWDLSFIFAYHLNQTVGFHGGYQLISFKRTTGEGSSEITNEQLTEGLFVGVGLVF